jgi:hypothetical protein
VNTMHDECAAIHSRFRSFHEIGDGGTACPGCIYECIGMEYRFEVFPFTVIADVNSTFCRGTGNRAILLRVRGFCSVLGRGCLGRCFELRFLANYQREVNGSQALFVQDPKLDDFGDFEFGGSLNKFAGEVSAGLHVTSSNR